MASAANRRSEIDMQLPDALVQAAAGCGVVPPRCSSAAECAKLAREHGAAILVGVECSHSAGVSSTEDLPSRCFGEELLAQQPAVHVAIQWNDKGGRLALEGLQGAMVDPATIAALQRGDITMESYTEADFDGPHIDGPANFGHLRPDYFFLACAHECSEGGESLLLDGDALVDALIDHTGTDLEELLCVSDEQAAAETIPDVELAEDTETVITIGIRRPWRNRLFHTLPSGRRVIRPGNGETFPLNSVRDPAAQQTREVMQLWQKMVDVAGRLVPRFKLHVGEALLVDNYRLLHGRDRYFDLQRRMFRVWFWTRNSIGLPSHLQQAYPHLTAQRGLARPHGASGAAPAQTAARAEPPTCLQPLVRNPEDATHMRSLLEATVSKSATQRRMVNASTPRQRRLGAIAIALHEFGDTKTDSSVAGNVVFASLASPVAASSQTHSRLEVRTAEDAYVQEFTKRGFVAIPNVLSLEELKSLNAAVEKDRERFYYLWPLANHEPFGAQGPCFANMNILLTSPDAGFDEIITHPKIYPLAKRLMGDEIRFEEFSVTIREPIAEPQPNGIKQQAWHRDDSHWLDHPLLLRSLSVVVYLTDVDESTHSFSIVPESLQAKQQLPGVGDPQTEEHVLEDSEYNQPDANAAPGSAGSAVDVEGAAGTAIFFHTGNLHAGTVRQTPRHRHSIHLYYGHASLPPLSDRLTAIPTRLSNSSNPEIRQLFSKKNEITKLFESNFQAE